MTSSNIPTEVLDLQRIILEECKGIDPAYAFQAAMGVYNYYHPTARLTSSVSVNLATGEETPIFKDYPKTQ